MILEKNCLHIPLSIPPLCCLAKHVTLPLCLRSHLGWPRIMRHAGTAQRVMGIVFTAMGLITMIFPQRVLDISFQGDFLLSPSNSSVVSSSSFSPLSSSSSPSSSSMSYSPILLLVVRCFGSQACLCGLLILITKFNKRTNLYFGLAMIPYLVFDAVGYVSGVLTLFGAIGDALGNLVFVTCCLHGYRRGDVEGCEASAAVKSKKED